MISKIKRGLVLILLTTFVWSSCGAAVEEEDYEDDVRPVATFVPTLKEVNEKLVQFSKLLKGKKVIQPAEEFACKLMSVKSSSCRLFISDDRQSLCLEDRKHEESLYDESRCLNLFMVLELYKASIEEKFQMTTPSTVIPTNVVSTTTFTTTTISRYSETALLFRSGNEFSTPPPPSTVSMSAPPSTLSTTSSPTIVSVQEMSVFASMGKNTSAGNTSPFEAHINTFLMLFDDLTKLNSTELIQKYSAPCLAGWLVPKVFNTVDRFFLHRVRQKFDIPKNFWFFNALGCSVLNCFLYLFIKKCCGVKIFNVFTPSGQRHVPDEQVRAILARSETLPMNVLSPKRDCSSRASINSDLPEIVLVESPSLTPKSYKKDSCR